MAVFRFVPKRRCSIGIPDEIGEIFLSKPSRLTRSGAVVYCLNIILSRPAIPG